ALDLLRALLGLALEILDLLSHAVELVILLGDLLTVLFSGAGDGLVGEPGLLLFMLLPKRELLLVELPLNSQLEGLLLLLELALLLPHLELFGLRFEQPLVLLIHLRLEIGNFNLTARGEVFTNLLLQLLPSRHHPAPELPLEL